VSFTKENGKGMESFNLMKVRNILENLVKAKEMALEFTKVMKHTILENLKMVIWKE